MEHDNDNTAPKNGSSVTNEPFLGERAVIRGTGQWWSGSNFRVTIVDMDDKTVKGLISFFFVSFLFVVPEKLFLHFFSPIF